MFEKDAEEWIMNNSKNIINKVSNGETNLFGIAEQAYQKVQSSAITRLMNGIM